MWEPGSDPSVPVRGHSGDQLRAGEGIVLIRRIQHRDLKRSGRGHEQVRVEQEPLQRACRVLLVHVLDGQQTIAEAAGLSLGETWRLHPSICAFTSEQYYEDRLKPFPGLENQAIRGTARFAGSGLFYVPVEHAANQNRSMEEVETVRRIVGELLEPGVQWVDPKSESRALKLADILVVAPNNSQVAALRSALPDGARVGTVDKFQGQEAPVVIYSMASSSAEDARRGMSFLYDPHRLNVATSRARCVCILVASPRLFAPACSTPEQMRLANGLCRYKELSVEVGEPGLDG